MRKIILGIAAASAMLALTPAAYAAQGCGVGWHRGPYGRCHPNRGPVLIVPGGPVVGVFYPHRGWWDGHRYWANRHHWHGGWRYR
ncbi:GCG_CRPN prefix-to-repeats domain-containing protein [Mesorhizobium loti]|uniref:GCG_CRPN prefix-to-repeats domain-containing protein n=1 Tax=Rhizobium loti TaxID=381 RepID=UPI0009E4B8A3